MAQRLGVEADRLLHGREGEELQEVVLQDVARRPGGVVEGGPALDADVLGHRDLHAVHVVGVPHGFEERVGEAQGEKVLHRLLAEVVVDAEDVLRREDAVHEVVELPRGGEVVPEGLLHDDAPPAAPLGVSSAMRVRSSCLRTWGKATGGMER